MSLPEPFQQQPVRGCHSCRKRCLATVWSPQIVSLAWLMLQLLDDTCEVGIQSSALVLSLSLSAMPPHPGLSGSMETETALGGPTFGISEGPNLALRTSELSCS